ncbi:MAG TPA: hypothetical protein VM537_07485, partial [Anaerolineae bacterium]|nr:hypothetical protein [Anaerolineae bacterium]
CGGASMWAATTHDGVHLVDLHIHTAGANAIVHLDSWCAVVNCEVEGNTGANFGIDVNSGSTIARCHVHDCAYPIAATRSVVFGNFVEDTVVAITRGITANNETVVVGNVIKLATVAAIGIYSVTGGGAHIIGNSIYNSAAGTGAGISLNIVSGSIINNVIEGFSGTGGDDVDFGSDPVPVVVGNAYYNCTNHFTNQVATAYAANNDELAASPFTAPGTNDFTIDGTQAGATEDAWPAAFLGAASTVNLADKGAVQAGAGTAGGGMPILMGSVVR